MTVSNIATRVAQMVAQMYGIDLQEVTPDTRLDGDNMKRIELMMALEEAFGIKIPDDQDGKIQTVGDAQHYIVMYSEP